MQGRLDVTVLTGTPGTDGARSFEQLIQRAADSRLSAIVPKRSKKRNRASEGVTVIPTTEHLVRLGQGCSCCTVRGDLMAKLQRIARDQSADHVLIHAAPHADLRTLAKTFTVTDENGSVLSDIARIGSLVTVVNAARFFDTIDGKGSRALMERVELGNVVLVENTAGIDTEDLSRVLSAIEALNAGASIVVADDDELDLSSLHATQSFDLDLAEQRAAGTEAPDGVSAGTVRFSYQARRPFHPTRLHAVLAEGWTGLLRAKGTFWVATKPDFACALDVAGGNRTSSPEGMWWATVPEHERPESPEFKRYLETIWHPDFGDRHQNISIVGVGLDESEIRARLDTALLTDEETASPEQWAAMPDPFPWPAANA